MNESYQNYAEHGGYLTHTGAVYENNERIEFQDAPDFTTLDTAEEIIKERLQKNEPIEDVLREVVENAVEEERREIMAEVLLKILMIIKDSNNPLLEVEVLIEAAGLPLREGKTQSEIAASHGITRAAFSARVQKMLKKFNLNPPRTCKRVSTKDTYRLTNVRKQRIN